MKEEKEVKEEKKDEEKPKEEPKQSKSQSSVDTDDDLSQSDNSHFMTYMIIGGVLVVLAYIIAHNKKKIIGTRTVVFYFVSLKLTPR